MQCSSATHNAIAAASRRSGCVAAGRWGCTAALGRTDRLSPPQAGAAAAEKEHHYNHRGVPQPQGPSDTQPQGPSDTHAQTHMRKGPAQVGGQVPIRQPQCVIARRTIMTTTAEWHSRRGHQRPSHAAARAGRSCSFCESFETASKLRPNCLENCLETASKPHAGVPRWPG